MQTAGVNYYSVLGVLPNASANDIKQKYRELSKKYHPDTLGGDTARMSLINEAYSVLSDPGKKYLYQPPQSKQGPIIYQKAAKPQRYNANSQAQTIDEEPENQWYVFLSYVLAIPVAILIFSVGFPLFQKLLPKAETTTTTRQTLYANPNPKNAQSNVGSPAPQRSPATRTPATTVAPGSTNIDSQTQNTNTRSNLYYEYSSQQ